MNVTDKCGVLYTKFFFCKLSKKELGIHVFFCPFCECVLCGQMIRGLAHVTIVSLFIYFMQVIFFLFFFFLFLSNTLHTSAENFFSVSNNTHIVASPCTLEILIFCQNLFKCCTKDTNTKSHKS